jgi:putative NIF3 family GTP cyclohydrolase 1 type 2
MMVEVTDLRENPLEKEGWERRSILDEPRLGEVVQMYEEMGLEVLVTDIEAELGNGCKSCVGDQYGKLKVVFTRNRDVGGGQ